MWVSHKFFCCLSQQLIKSEGRNTFSKFRYGRHIYCKVLQTNKNIYIVFLLTRQIRKYVEKKDVNLVLQKYLKIHTQLRQTRKIRSQIRQNWKLLLEKQLSLSIRKFLCGRKLLKVLKY